MKINDQLNLVIPIRTDDQGNPTAYAYHSPIARDVFEANYRMLAATKAALSSKGAMFLMGTGPTIATLTLRDEGKRDAIDRGHVDKQGIPLTDDVDAFLLELKRLTTVLVPGPAGWENLPIDVALNKNLIDDEDWRETESAIVFFTVHSSLCLKTEREKILRATTSLLNASRSSLPPMEFIASLPTSTPSEVTAAKVASSVPY